MCEFTSWINKKMALRFVSNCDANDLNIHGLSERFPYALQENRCPKCGRYLEDFERRPLGRATRSMCLEHYENLITNNFSYECIVCGRPLPDEKRSTQHRNNREVKHHLHDGPCTHIWTITHNVSVGEPDMVRRFGKKVHRVFTIELPDHPNMTDYAITADLVPARSWEQLSNSAHTPKALPYPGPQTKIPVQRIYDGTAVKLVSRKLER